MLSRGAMYLIRWQGDWGGAGGRGGRGYLTDLVHPHSAQALALDEQAPRVELAHARDLGHSRHVPWQRGAPSWAHQEVCVQKGRCACQYLLKHCTQNTEQYSTEQCSTLQCCVWQRGAPAGVHEEVGIKKGRWACQCLLKHSAPTTQISTVSHGLVQYQTVVEVSRGRCKPIAFTR